MVSRSYSNLLDLVSDGGGGRDSSPGHGKKLTRVMTVAGIISDLEDEEDGSPKPRQQQQRVIVVGNQLPLRAHRRPDDGKWSFSWDEDSLLFQLRDGLGAGGDGVEVLYVGCLRADPEVVEPAEQEEVSRLLLDSFRCVPAFVPGELHSRFYHGFCKQHLWPLFHYMLPLSRDLGGRFDRSLWQAYVSVNKFFADKVMEVISSDSGDGNGDLVWVHDYHLMLLPTFLRRRHNRVRLGFFLHSPFPSSEIYRTLPVRDELLRALLNADLIGFHTFDYARHFLSSCSRVLGLGYESKRGYIGIDYYGRTVNVKILPVGVHMGQLAHAMALPETEARIADLVAGNGRFRGKTVLLGVDDMDIFKGISLKLLAMEQVLEQHPEWRGKLVLVQVANPARGRGRDVQEVRHETYSTVERINRRYGGAPGEYEPVVLIDRPLEFYERVAYYAVAECCLVTAVRDGMNLIPYEYIVSRQGLQAPPARSMLVVSEFIGCSPSLSGAIRVNPWNVDAVAEAMYAALVMGDAEKQLRHDKNYRYVSTHDAGYWARSFLQDLGRACRDHARRRCWGLGFGLGFRIVALDPSFRKLSLDHIVSAYRRANHRAILLDYDGTMAASHGSGSSSVSRSPAPETIAILNSLCRDPRNTVYLVGASDKETLAAWFAACDGGLVLAAEHGYFLRQRQGSEWTTTRTSATSFEWKKIAEPIMELYTEATDGSSIETKESGVVWHHEHADPDFGSCQAKELLDHLETVLANEPVSVKRSHGIVEVKPQGVAKGLVAEQLLAAMQEKGTRADFVLFVGDDRSDEDMFEVINNAASGPELSLVAEVFACTVGQKPSKAKYYLEDTAEIIRMLQGLADASDKTMVHQPASASTSI